MKITTTVHNMLLKRHEVTAVLESPSNPGFTQAQTQLAQALKVAEEVIVVRAVRSHFGSSSFVVEAFAYDSLEDKQRIEPKPKVATKKGAA